MRAIRPFNWNDLAFINEWQNLPIWALCTTGIFSAIIKNKLLQTQNVYNNGNEKQRMLILFSHLDMFERSTTYIVQWSLYIPSSCWYIACMKIESEKKINCDVFCQIDSVQDTMYEKYFDIFLNFKYQR